MKSRNGIKSVFPRPCNALFSFILILLVIYSAIYIYNTSFVIEGKRYYCLFDDTMISMRYAKNLAAGHGLVYNPGGEKVEGYTNLLWVLYMFLFHLFPISLSKISLCIQVSGLLFLLVNLLFAGKIADSISGGSTACSLGAVFLTAFYLPINTWSLVGTETAPITLLVSIVIWKAIKSIHSAEYDIMIIILLGVGTFIRPDMFVPFLGIGIFMAVADSRNRMKYITSGSAIILTCLVGQILFRTWYYGDILPNSYYLKLTGYPAIPRIARGLMVFIKFVSNTNCLFLMPFIILIFRRDKKILLLFWVILLQISYSIYVGGDAWEWWGGSNRYISIVMPVYFVLFSYVLSHAVKIIVNAIKSVTKSRVKHIKYIHNSIFAVSAVLCLVNFNNFNNMGSMKEFLLIKPTLIIMGNKDKVEQALVVRTITKPKAKMAVVRAGATPYFADRFAIDILGANDRKIAREKMRTFKGFRRYTGFYPGHLKYDYAYSIGQLKPDIVVELWHSRKEAMPYLKSAYRKVKLGRFVMYLRTDSTAILWEKVNSFHQPF